MSWVDWDEQVHNKYINCIPSNPLLEKGNLIL
jgi:hypothetical protein